MNENDKPASGIIGLFDGNNFQHLASLSQTTYPGREISSPEYLEWEYLDNPCGKAIISTAEKAGETVAQYVVLPRDFIVEGNKLKGSLSVNTLTHPGFRGAGLFPMLAENTFLACRKNKIQFTIGFPNNKSAPVIKRKNLFFTIGHLPLLIKFFNPVKSIFRFLSSPKIKSGAEIEIQIPAPVNNCAPLKMQEENNKIEEFITHFNSTKTICTNRSSSYLQWRYIDIPLRKYTIFKHGDGNVINTILVFRSRYIFGIRCGIIVDIITNNEFSLKKILQYINDIAILNKLDLIFSTVPVASAEFAALNKFGYHSLPRFLLPQKLPVIVRKHTENCPLSVTDFKKWYLTFGDYDIF